MEDPDYILDISGIEKIDAGAEPEASKRAGDGSGRKCIYILFDCCGCYSHIYINRNGTAYEGRCPKCLRPISVKIGEGGTNQRFFRAQ